MIQVAKINPVIVKVMKTVSIQEGTAVMEYVKTLLALNARLIPNVEKHLMVKNYTAVKMSVDLLKGALVTLTKIVFLKTHNFLSIVAEDIVQIKIVLAKMMLSVKLVPKIRMTFVVKKQEHVFQKKNVK